MFIIKHGIDKFYIEQEEVLAEITFRIENNLITIEHTIVSDKLQGQGVGAQLVEKLVSHARMHKKKVASECDYAAHFLKKRADFQDVVIQDE